MKEWIGIIVMFSMIISLPAAWLTHVYTCFTTEAWGFLIAGAVFFPVGIVHGFGLWLGCF